MCTLGHVATGALVYDPFAGTGSVLVAAAAAGARVVGADIDIRAIRDGKRDSKGQRVNVYTNFRDYDLPDPAGLLRMDAAHAAWRRGGGGESFSGVFDALVCDPPYGVRAGGRTMAAAAADEAAKERTCAPNPPLCCHASCKWIDAQDRAPLL
jgi:tRNA (guanine10-N2)-methyltransferase